MYSAMFLHGTLSATMQYVRPKYMPMFFTKFYGNSTFMAIAWILVKNSGVHLGCLWQKHEQKTWCQKISHVYRMDARFIFSNVFPVSSGISSWVFFEKKKMSSFVHKHFMRTYFLFLQQNGVQLWQYAIQRLVKTSDVCHENWKYVLVKCLCTKLDIFSPQKHWKWSPWGYRKNIAENISCIYLVDIANFWHHVFVIQNQDEFHYFLPKFMQLSWRLNFHKTW